MSDMCLICSRICPERCLENDEKTERNRLKKNGRIDGSLAQNLAKASEIRFRPSHLTIPWMVKHNDITENRSAFAFDPNTGEMRFNTLIAAKAVLEKVKSEKGWLALAELDEHIGQAPTCCTDCGMKTGDREGFYAHLVSYRHIKNATERMARIARVPECPYTFDAATVLVNVLKKKDLVV